MKSLVVLALIVHACTAFLDTMPKVAYSPPNRQPEPQYGHTAHGLVRRPDTMPSPQPGPLPGPVYQPGPPSGPPPYSLHPGPVHQHGPPSQYSPFPIPVQQPGFSMGSSSPFVQSFEIPYMQNMMLTLIFGPAPQGFNPFPQQPQPQPPFVNYPTPSYEHRPSPQEDMAKKEKKPERELTYQEQLIEYSERLQREEQEKEKSKVAPEKEKSEIAPEKGKQNESTKTSEVAPAAVFGGPPPTPVIQPHSTSQMMRPAVYTPNRNTGIVPPSRIR